MAVHQHAAYAHRVSGGDNLPVTEQFYQRNLTLPMYPELADDSIELIITAVRGFF
jgi:dTDP-4-amino-4,6-dideoxygalactose transaminase